MELQNFKGIQSLKFDLPNSGTYLLAGTNGVGKTSLLACLLRIRQSSAFATNFFTSKLDLRLDDFRECQIVYTLDERKVVYVRGEERWVPQPRKESGLLLDFGYPDVVYIGANADRISPRAEDFNLKKLRNAKRSICEAANTIFETTKFTHLRETNVKQGVTPAFVLQVQNEHGVARYVSERNLSLGELCILKLLRRLESCVNGSLILIDEVELALHPRAQVLLFEYLESIAIQKGFTVILSSHSVTLIKSVDRKRIIFLERRGSDVVVVKGCFPAYALREVARKEERFPDSVLYVEDDAAKVLVERLCQLAVAKKYPNGILPTVQVIPIGGYENVLRFADRSTALLPDTVKRGVVLDYDAREGIEQVLSAGIRLDFIDIINRQKPLTKFLPWTPEIGLCLYLSENRAKIEQAMRDHYLNQYVQIEAVPGSVLTTTGSDQRNAAKAYIRDITQEICDLLPGRTTIEITEVLQLAWMADYFPDNTPQTMQILGAFL